MESLLTEKKNQLVEKLGVHFEQSEKIAPVAARIYSYIILTGKLGVTFEDLVLNLNASKSTISTHLNHLQEVNKITYFTKVGDRKKYFILTEDILNQTLSEMILQWKSEKELHEEIAEYKLEFNKDKIETPAFQFDLTYHDNYIQFLNLAITTLTDLKIKVSKIKLLK